MTPEHSALWQRIAAFEIDESGAEHPFSVRLAQEQGWSRAHARRVLEEYKRFAFLAVTAGHPVTPSKSVDQAWHLHLIYTRSYWGEFCPHVLQRPLHHEPSRGGSHDQVKYTVQYRQTLESYANAFGTVPPDDIWPKPAAACHAPRPSSVGQLRTWVPVAAVSLGLGGCASTVIAMSLNPLDYAGPQFLRFFGAFAVAVFALAWALRWRLRRGNVRFHARLDASDIYAVAALAGVDQALGAGMAVLAERKLVEVSPVTGTLKALGAIPQDAPLVERKIHARASSVLRPNIVDLRRTVAEALQPTIARMREAGWLLTEDARWRARFLPFLVALTVPLLAWSKVYVGLYRTRPVGFIVAGGLITAAVACLFLRRAWRTNAGDAELARLQREHDDVRRRGPAGAGGSASTALGVALFGAAIAGSSVYAMMQEITPADQRKSDSTGGCGSSGGDSGGGGGDGGGSGCGGCGGGD